VVYGSNTTLDFRFQNNTKGNPTYSHAYEILSSSKDIVNHWNKFKIGFVPGIIDDHKSILMHCLVKPNSHSSSTEIIIKDFTKKEYCGDGNFIQFEHKEDFTGFKTFHIVFLESVPSVEKNMLGKPVRKYKFSDPYNFSFKSTNKRSLLSSVKKLREENQKLKELVKKLEESVKKIRRIGEKIRR